jgi:hypothetical protein
MRTHDLYGSGYILNELGQIWSPYKKNYLRLSENVHGCAYTTIMLNSQKTVGILVHREVWKAFKSPIPFGGLIHKDGNKMNPALNNLEPKHPGWQYVEYVKQGITITKIAKHYDLPKKSISEVVSLLVPGGIRELRKQYPMNKSKDVV